MRAHLVTLATLLLLGAWPRPVHAELNLRLGGRVQSDVRFRLKSVGIGDWYDRKEAAAGISRNENIFKLKMDARLDRFGAVAELDFAYYGFVRQLDGIGGLSLREQVDPYRVEAQAVYVEALDLFVEGLDLRVGQQQVFWGKGDQFNPTNTINPLDLEDPLLFGEQLANLMVKLDYAASMDWTISAVLVPIFKPALLPDTAPIGVGASDRMPMIDESLRWRLHTEQAITEQLLGFPTVVSRAVPDMPERSVDNMQWALRVAGTVAEQDLALSYYWGRSDMPQSYLNLTQLVSEPRCNPADKSQCIKGLLAQEAHLAYPRMQVVGLNMAGQLDLLGWLSSHIQPIGYRIEAALIIPQATSISLLQREMDFVIYTQPEGEYPYRFGPGGQFPRPLVVDDTPFAKWVVGLDYTFGRHVYANLQWVHGFPDEFGAGDFISEGWSVRKGGVDSVEPVATCLFEASQQQCIADRAERVAREILRPRLGDYLVLGVDLKFLSDKLLVRLFSIWDLVGVYEEAWDEEAGRRVRTHHGMFTDQGFSAVLYPEVRYHVGSGFELHAGALLMLGKEHTKFGDPASGGHQIFTRARLTF